MNIKNGGHVNYVKPHSDLVTRYSFDIYHNKMCPLLFNSVLSYMIAQCPGIHACTYNTAFNWGIFENIRWQYL